MGDITQKLTVVISREWGEIQTLQIYICEYTCTANPQLIVLSHDKFPILMGIYMSIGASL